MKETMEIEIKIKEVELSILNKIKEVEETEEELKQLYKKTSEKSCLKAVNFLFDYELSLIQLLQGETKKRMKQRYNKKFNELIIQNSKEVKRA